jgi:hypothetical protein
MMKRIFTLLISFLFSWAVHAGTLEQRFVSAQAGDFIVTSQENNYSLLFIRTITADTLILEEISVPDTQVNGKKTNWKEWISKKAPGHTSWTLYEIDRKSGKLIECFSYSKNGWLYLDETEQFLTRLLTLHLAPVPNEERRKIGPQPSYPDEDRRAIWNPPLIVDGKKVTKPTFEVLKTQWPDDGSRLSACNIELYFFQDFPFPYWLEVHSPHYAFKLRTIDSGHNLHPSMSGPMPHRSPKFIGLTQKAATHWNLAIKTPAYHQKLQLFALDLTTHTTLPVPYTQTNTKNEEQLLNIAIADLRQILQNQHRYQWVLIPEDTRDVYVESEETFLWEKF